VSTAERLRLRRFQGDYSQGLEELLTTLGVEQAMAANATASAAPKEVYPPRGDTGVRRLIAEQMEREVETVGSEPLPLALASRPASSLTPVPLAVVLLPFVIGVVVAKNA
jgi:hypothetical protein